LVVFFHKTIDFFPTNNVFTDNCQYTTFPQVPLWVL